MSQQPYFGGDTPAEDAWNVMWLGGVLLPGMVENCVAKKGRKLDEKNPKGADAPQTDDNGYSGGTLAFDLFINGPDAWQAFQDMLPNIDPQKPGATVAPLEVQHPEPNAIGITKIRIKDITGYQPRGGERKRYHFECIQWFPAPKAAKSTSTAKTRDQQRGPAQDIPLIVPDFMDNTFKSPGDLGPGP